MTDLNLAEILIEAGVITPMMLRRSSRRALVHGTSIATQLEELGYVSRDEVATIVARRLELEWVDLDRVQIPNDAAQIVSAKLARKWGVVPGLYDGSLLLACADPTDCGLYDDFDKLLDSGEAYLAIASERQIRARYQEVYGCCMPRKRGIYEDILWTEPPKAGVCRCSAHDVSRIGRLVETLLEDAQAVEGAVHILREEAGYRVCLVVGDEQDELCRIPEGLFGALEAKFQSLIDPKHDHGEFVVAGFDGDATFLLDVDHAVAGTQLYVSFLDRAAIVPASRSRITVELPIAMLDALQGAALRQECTISELVERAWSMTSEAIETPYICPYVEPSATKVRVELVFQPDTLGHMQAAARQHGQSIEWVLNKLYMMSRECLLR